MSKSLSHIIRNIEETGINVLKTGVQIAFIGLITYNFVSHNGYFDSHRTKEAIKYHNSINPIKTVAAVEETWKDDNVYSPFLDGFNPQVTREITFDDNSKTRLQYRTCAWPVLRKTFKGAMFNPQPGEKYEVTSNNSLVQKISQSGL